MLFVIGSVSGQVIKGKIDGDFEGWEGETIVKLTNGDIWQQTEYYNKYHYAYSPEVILVRDGSGYKMKVDGVSKAVSVQRLITQQTQQRQQQQVLPDYSPVIDAMKDKRTPEERKKQEEEYADGWEEGLAWNAMMKEKHPILLKVFQGVVLYGCYLLIQGEID